jgi:F-type H+-transporting ATPase subunit b
MIENVGRRGRILWMGAVLFMGTLIFCGLSLAAEGAHGDRSGDLMDLLYRFINFALLVIILFVVLKKANIKGLLASRTEELKKRLAELRAGKEEAERKYRELEKRIREFEQSRQGIIDQFRAEGLAEKNRLIAEAEERAKQILEQAEATVRREVESAKNRLRRDMIGLAAENAEKILCKEINDDDQERLVNEFIERLGKGH